MDVARIRELIKELAHLDTSHMYQGDFLLTWEKSDAEIRATFSVAEILRGLRRNNVSVRIFDSGLAISLFRDQSTRTRFSFASACNCWVWRSRSWMKANPRWLMAKRYGRRPTWYRSWLRSSASAMICTSARDTPTWRKLPRR